MTREWIPESGVLSHLLSRLAKAGDVIMLPPSWTQPQLSGGVWVVIGTEDQYPSISIQHQYPASVVHCHSWYYRRADITNAEFCGGLFPRQQHADRACLPSANIVCESVCVVVVDTLTVMERLS